MWRNFDQLTTLGIQQLLDDEEPESRILEYKVELPSKSDKDRKEFAADLASFANAAGGHIVYGVEELKDADGKNTGKPKCIPGLVGVNADEAVRRLDGMARTNIDPPIPGLTFRSVDGFPAPVIVAHIPRSWAAPHMVAVTRDSRFYVRGSAGKHPLTTAEIRSAFQLSAEQPDRIRRFRDERLGRIASGETPVLLEDQGKVVVHIIPVEALTSDRGPVNIGAWAADTGKLQPFETGGGWNSRYNFDGFVTHSGPRSGPDWSYLQILRTGIIESVTTLQRPQPDGSRFLNPWGVEEETVSGLRRVLALCEQFGANVPVAILISLLGVRGSRLPPSPGRMLRDRSIERDDLLLPDVLVEAFDVDLPALMRPTFDALWQSLGVSGSLCYDKEGNWDAAGFRW